MTSLLVLGGTSFVGRHIVESALDSGHDVTVFNRGQTNAELFPGVERLTGDRSTGDYASLAGRTWDACIDVSAYFPHQVREVGAAIGSAVGHYTYISTVSVYRPSTHPVDETSPLLDVGPGEGATERTGETYGPLKVLCEQAAGEIFDGRLTVVRPGIVAGPYDPTGRFTSWVRRLTRPGPMLASRPDSPVQVIHGRDLGDFVVGVTDASVAGTFNATGPTSNGVPLSEVIDVCAEAAAVHRPEVVWVDEDFIAAYNVPLPLYLASSAESDGLEHASCERAVGAGLVNRPLLQTASDTLAWLRAPGGGEAKHVELLTPERESELLALWAQQST
ncbi:MAG TPA: NAD-dependent epimerase/dehydratase family protein [Mycobacteriales bacterium]|nr:NAD-dependent epimerase/dehydratase family protein [Mycobacteriales bacterium]